MLKRLYLENFALVDKLEIEFFSGMNVLTGETGAGKSIIVGALARILGETAEKDDIRSGFKMAAAEADFDISGRDDIAEALKRLEIEPDGDIITIRREIFLKKASRCLLNSQQITLKDLRPLSTLLAELYGQHSHQLLLDENNHLGFLDHFGGLDDDAETVRDYYYNWEAATKRLSRLLATRDHAQRERELLLFQKEEIEKAEIQVGEEEKLLAERKILDSSRTLNEKSNLILSLLDDRETSAIELLGGAQKELSDMARLDETLKDSEELIEQAVINIEELRANIEAYRSSIPDDPARQEEINLRLDELFRLKKKYGGSEESILKTLEEIDHGLINRPDVDREIKQFREQEKNALAEYTEKAFELSQKRHDAAKKISSKVEQELAGLGMDKARFSFEFICTEDDKGIEHNGRRLKPFPEGLENGRFLITANPGEPPKPLARTASGGEISRIMLAIKAAERDRASACFLVFDEIDVGIGGMTALAVAEKLASLAKHQQLLVITHLHQIAKEGTHHFAVQKNSETKEGRRTIKVKYLSKNEKSAEIKRMLALTE